MTKSYEPAAGEMSQNHAVFDGGTKDGHQMSVLTVRLPTMTLVGAMNAADMSKLSLDQFIANALSKHISHKTDEIDSVSK